MGSKRPPPDTRPQARPPDPLRTQCLDNFNILVCPMVRGCTLAGSKVLEFVKYRTSVMFRVWAAPGAPETLANGGGRCPQPFARVSGAPGAAQTPKMIDFRPCFLFESPPKVQPRIGLPVFGVPAEPTGNQPGTGPSSRMLPERLPIGSRLCPARARRLQFRGAERT